MKGKSEIELAAQWDKSVVPANEPRKRGLLIDVRGIAEQNNDRRPVNLSLVIDRSGSMGGGKIEAAKLAAKGVVEGLTDKDVLSVVDFDSEVSTLVSGIRLTPAGKREAVEAINRLHARGTTNLAGGWLEGATRAAEVIDRTEHVAGHVVLLSDGHANVGITNPGTLREHADEMASRGVTTSTVGVGNDYSPLQLEALSEGGLGRLHDAGTPDEIIETILGELGDVVSIVATDVKVDVTWPHELHAELLADYQAVVEGNQMTIRLGQLLGNSQRTVPLMVDVPKLPLGGVMEVVIKITGKDPETGKQFDSLTRKARLEVAVPATSHATPRDQNIAERIALLWESTVGLGAMRLNELGDFVGATSKVRDDGDKLRKFAAGTGVENVIHRNLRQAERKVSRSWEGRSKRESMIAAKKFSKGERDHRSDPKGDWSDHL